MRIWSTILRATIAICSLTTGAVAQDAPPEPQAAKGWRLDVGAGAIAFPRFQGAKDLRFLPIPAIEIRYEDLFFASVRDGVGFNLLRSKGFTAGPIARFAFPREEKTSREALSGLGDVDFAIEAGGFARYDFGRYASAKVEVRQGVNGHEGLVVDAGLDLNAPPLGGNRLFLSAGPRASFYDGRYARSYYGVTSVQSARSDYPTFRPGEGYRAGAGAAAAYLVSERTTAVVFGDYSRLLGDIANSPITRSRYGSRHQVTLGASVSYRFDFGG